MESTNKFTLQGISINDVFMLSKDGQPCTCPNLQPLVFTKQNSLGQQTPELQWFFCTTQCAKSEILRDGDKAYYKQSCGVHERTIPIENIEQFKKPDAAIGKIIDFKNCK